MAYSLVSTEEKLTLNWTVPQIYEHIVRFDRSTTCSGFHAVGHRSQFKWTLSLIPTYNNMVGLSLQLEQPEDIAIKIGFKVNLVDAANRVRDDYCFQGKGETFEKRVKVFEKRLCPQFFNRGDVINDNNGLLFDGKIRIRCEIVFVEEEEEEEKDFPEFTLSEDIKSLMRDDTLSDVILKVEGKEIKAHRLILASRSTVFKAMFGPETKESKEGVVDIKEMEEETCQAMVTFIYTDNVEPEACSFELLNGAEMYDLKRLKVICEKELASRLTIENAVQSLVEADKVKAIFLIKAVTKFMLQNVKQLRDTEEWQEKMSRELLLHLFYQIESCS